MIVASIQLKAVNFSFEFFLAVGDEIKKNQVQGKAKISARKTCLNYVLLCIHYLFM